MGKAGLKEENQVAEIGDNQSSSPSLIPVLEVHTALFWPPLPSGPGRPSPVPLCSVSSPNIAHSL